MPGLSAGSYDPVIVDARFPPHRVAPHERLVVGVVGDGHAQVAAGDGGAVELGPKAEGVSQVRGAHRAGETAPKLRAGPYEAGTTGGDEVCRVHMSAVGCFADQQRSACPLGQPFVRGDRELPNWLLVPEVAGVGERMPR